MVWADRYDRFAPVTGESGQSQFAPLKLRSLALVPSSGAQSAPTDSTYGSSTVRLVLPHQGATVRDSRSFRAPASLVLMREISDERNVLPLPNDQILAWNKLALSQEARSVLGMKGKISGVNLFTRLNYWIVFCGGEALSNSPALQSVEAPTEAVVTLTPTKFTFELESEPENVQDLKLIIQASAPQSNGVTRAYIKAVQIGGVLEAVTEEYDTRKTTTTSTAPLMPPPQRSS